jgi:hypothetical protein
VSEAEEEKEDAQVEEAEEEAEAAAASTCVRSSRATNNGSAYFCESSCTSTP